jgi:hypothetical protein
VIVPIDRAPPGTDEGFRTSDVRLVARTVRTVARVSRPAEAEMSTLVVVFTGREVTRKEAEVSPEGTKTISGTEAMPGVALVRVTIIPPPGAGAVSVTRPKAATLPVTLPGSREIDASVVGRTRSVAVRERPPQVAVTATAVSPTTRVVVIGKVVLLAPGATTRLSGRVATPAASLASVTTAPPSGAGPVSVTSPVADPPPVRLEGVSVRDARAVGSTVSVADRVIPPQDAVMTTGVGAVTEAVVTRSGPVVQVDMMATLAGTAAIAGSELVNVTRVPPGVAPSLRRKVPIARPPPAIASGEKASHLSVTGRRVSVTVQVAPP